MKINLADTTKLENAITAAEIGCSARTITVDDIREEVARIEKRLATMLLKKDWAGLMFSVDCNAQAFPNAYKGIPESTQFTVTRFPSGWFVTGVQRNYTRSRAQRIAPWTLATKAEELVAFASDSKNW